MTVLVQNIRRYSQANPLICWGAAQQRLAAVTVLVALVLAVPGSWQGVTEALSDAYLAVSIFVAGTLALVYGAERAFKTDLGVWLQQYQRWQVPVAAALGAFPGCGGAIIAITQYSRGYMSFGGVVATLTATMGDAMFLLLADSPQTAMSVLIIGVVVGVISGYSVDAIHGRDFLRPESSTTSTENTQSAVAIKTKHLSRTEQLWVALIIPGLIIGLLAAIQIDVDQWLSSWTEANPAFVLGVIGAVFAVSMWLRNGGELQHSCAVGEKPALARAVIHTTNFVTTWVVFAFVGYEVLIASTGIDLVNAFSIWGPLVPAVAVLIGLIPGCGPQILVTSFYLSGAIPLSAQLANAISNDGDALFPAIAVAPKAALAATVYSAIPALIAGYGWYWLVE